jgi:polyisoprenoid-binding protein YceI
MKKHLLGIALGSLLFTAGSAVAADYKIDKEGQHAFVNFRIQHLDIAGCTAPLKILTAHSPLTRKILPPIKSM